MNNHNWKKAVLLSALLLPSLAVEAAEAPVSPKLPEEDTTHVEYSVSDGVLRPSYDGEETRETVQKDKDKKKNKETADTGISKEHPATVVADKMRYNDTTGEVAAFGRVEIKHMMDTYQTEYVYGNTISQKYVVPGELVWKNPTTDLKAARADYDAKAAVGHFEKVSGWDSGTYYFQGESGTYDKNANHIVIEHGYFTTKHAVAKVPDYRIEADSIDIYPGDKYIAHNVRLMAKNTVLVTLSTYKGSLQKKRFSPFTLIPRPVFDSDNGFGLHNRIEIPLDADMNLTAYMENRWYTKAGYKPDVGVRYQTPVGGLNFHYAEEESSTNDDGGIWVKKRPSLEFNSNHFYLFGSRFYVGAKGDIGYWEEDGVKGQHKSYDAYISGDPWKLGKFMRFSWRAGYMRDYYSYNGGNIRKNTYYSLGLSGGYRSVQSWIYYTDREINGFTPYRYDSYTSDKPLDFGVRVQPTKNDAFSLAWTVDTKYGRLNHRYWTYYRDMHSFYAWIRYDDIEKATQFMLMPKDFRF